MGTIDINSLPRIYSPQMGFQAAKSFDFDGVRLYHAAAMSSGLPLQIQVQKAVAKAMCLEGTLNLTRLKRLQRSLMGSQGDVKIKLSFERGQDKHAYVHGNLESDLVMQCQRCMGEMIYHLDTELSLQLVKADAESESEADSVEVIDGQLLLHEFIEDEMILALPVVPMHESVLDCEEGQTLQKYLKQEAEGERNPFAILQQLKPNSTSTR